MTETDLENFKNVNIKGKKCIGKFEGNFNCNFGEALHQATLEGGTDDDLGDVEGFGWYGKMNLKDMNITEDGEPIAGVIVSEDNSGFFDYTTYSSEKELDKAWNNIESEYEDFSKESEEDM